MSALFPEMAIGLVKYGVAMFLVLSIATVWIYLDQP